MSLTEHLMASAERELGAFTSAVSELFGADHAQRAADDWLAELDRAEFNSIDSLPEARREFRAVTIAAAVRIADRLNAHDGLPGRCTLDASDEIAEPTREAVHDCVGLFRKGADIPNLSAKTK